jgi:ferredoxin, 2Fe-2S
MPKVRFILGDGSERHVDVPSDCSLMYGATRNGIPGIDGDCGGFCNCATCHVYVTDEWLSRLDPASEHEREMLDGTVSDRRQNSRLGCQIPVTNVLDGITVTLPEKQN